MKLNRPYDYRRPMSKKVALLITRELWQWLADNPENISKNDWPKWSKVNRIYGNMEAHCPCCEFAIREKIKTLAFYTRCKFCPLLGYAWSMSDDKYANYCASDGEPYALWCEVSREAKRYGDNPERRGIRRTSALQIVEGCNKALKALELEKLMVNVSTLPREEV